MSSAIFYNMGYLWFAYKLYTSVFEYDYETMGAPSSFEVFKDMYMVYNLILHFPILIINNLTVWQELEMEKFQWVSFWASGHYANTSYSLDKADFGQGWHELLWILNPFSYFDVIWEIFFGYSFYDVFKK